MNYKIIPDEPSEIKKTLLEEVEKGANMVIFTGGTGLSKRDITPETILPLLDREMPGVAEAIRKHGQERTPYSMLSRSVSGAIGNTLALPCSTNGAKESMEAVFPSISHVFKVFAGGKHV